MSTMSRQFTLITEAESTGYTTVDHVPIRYRALFTQWVAPSRPWHVGHLATRVVIDESRRPYRIMFDDLVYEPGADDFAADQNFSDDLVARMQQLWTGLPPAANIQYLVVSHPAVPNYNVTARYAVLVYDHGCFLCEVAFRVCPGYISLIAQTLNNISNYTTDDQADTFAEVIARFEELLTETQVRRALRLAEPLQARLAAVLTRLGVPIQDVPTVAQQVETAETHLALAPGGRGAEALANNFAELLAKK